MVPAVKDIFRVLTAVKRGQGILHRDRRIVSNLVSEELIRSTQDYPSDPATGRKTCTDSQITRQGRAWLKTHGAVKTRARLAAGGLVCLVVLVAAILNWAIPELLEWLSARGP